MVKEMTEHECIVCFVRYGLPAGYYDRRRKDGKSWMCPNGHSMSFTESEADKIRQERDHLAQRLAQKDAELADAYAAQHKAEGRIKKLEKRSAAGVCSCCNRTFQNVARHMKTKHPDFKPKVVA